MGWDGIGWDRMGWDGGREIKFKAIKLSYG